MKLSLLLFTQGDSGWRQPGFSRAGGSLAFVLAKVQAKESSALRQNWLLQCFSVWTDQWSVEFLFQWMATVGHVDRLPSWIDTLGSQICWWGWYMKLYEPLRYVEPPTSCFNPASQRLKCFGTKQTRQPWFKIWRHHLIFMHDGPTCCVETHLLNWNLWDKLLPVVFAICNGLVTNLYGAWTKPELTQFQPTLIGQGKLQWTQHSCCLMPPNTPGFSSFVLFHSQGCDCWVNTWNTLDGIWLLFLAGKPWAQKSGWHRDQRISHPDQPGGLPGNLRFLLVSWQCLSVPDWPRIDTIWAMKKPRLFRV